MNTVPMDINQRIPTEVNGPLPKLNVEGSITISRATFWFPTQTP